MSAGRTPVEVVLERGAAWINVIHAAPDLDPKPAIEPIAGWGS